MGSMVRSQIQKNAPRDQSDKSQRLDRFADKLNVTSLPLSLFSESLAIGTRTFLPLILNEKALKTSRKHNENIFNCCSRQKIFLKHI
jgi:hypothetical protein